MKTKNQDSDSADMHAPLFLNGVVRRVKFIVNPETGAVQRHATHMLTFKCGVLRRNITVDDMTFDYVRCIADKICGRRVHSLFTNYIPVREHGFSIVPRGGDVPYLVTLTEAQWNELRDFHGAAIDFNNNLARVGEAGAEMGKHMRKLMPVFAAMLGAGGADASD